jgi:hypothetical protein
MRKITISSYILKLVTTSISVFIYSSVNSQTFFESAKDDGIIVFSSKRISQVKLNFSSTAITYGYYYVGGKAIDKRRFLFTGEVKAKPNDEGIATLAKEGRLQPGIKGNIGIGHRFNRNLVIPQNWGVLDIYLKTEYNFNAYTIYDSTRVISSLKPLYKTNKSSLGINFLLNYATAIGKTNLFFGGQIGLNATNNADDLSKGNIQTIQSYSGSLTQFVIKDIEEAKIGQLTNSTKAPLKLDLIFDPGLQLNNEDKTNILLGMFGYFRSDVKDNDPKQRIGFGLCLLDAQNPSRVFSSIGYELPKFGKGVTNDDKEKDKGVVFVSIGYSIF